MYSALDSYVISIYTGNNEFDLSAPHSASLWRGLHSSRDARHRQLHPPQHRQEYQAALLCQR